MLKYFKAFELVPKDLYNEEGEAAIRHLTPEVLEVLVWLREKIGSPITVNTWAKGGFFQYRGFRPKDCNVGGVNSAHKKGMAIDFDVKGMTAQAVRDWLHVHKMELPHKIRLETGVNWVHLDTFTKDQIQQIKYFTP
jgi:hypothetical protein